MFSKYGINGLWGEEAFERHTLLKTKMQELGIPVPTWWDSLGEKCYQDGFPSNNTRPLHHRRMSNNSIAFTKKPEQKFLEFVFDMMRSEGEPAFVNLEELALRRLKQRGISKPSETQLEAEINKVGMNPCAK